MAKGQKIRAYDLETGKLIGEYKSMNHAAEENYTSIDVVCNAFKKTNGISRKLGIIWEKVNDEN